MMPIRWNIARISAALSVLVLPLGTGAAAGPNRIEKTFEATSDPRVTLINQTGHIVVKGWDRPQLHVVYTTQSPRVAVDLDQIPAKGRAEKVHFTTRVLSPLPAERDKAADFTLDLPFGSSVEIRNSEGSVQIERLDGEASVHSVGGAITVSEIGGHISVRSIGGDIEVIRPAGAVEASSICGSLRFVSPTGSQVRAVTTSGKIFYEGDFAAHGHYELEDNLGDIEVITPATASLDLYSLSVKGKVMIDPELSLTRTRSSSHPAGSSAWVSRTGDATVELRSFRGNIRVRRMP